MLVAVVDEAACIGCTLCIAACPIDAILGAQKRMHTVLPSLCSGCELCVAPCPVDCITLQPAQRDWTLNDAASARDRFAARATRLARNERIAKRALPVTADIVSPNRAQRQAVVGHAVQNAGCVVPLDCGVHVHTSFAALGGQGRAGGGLLGL